MLLVVQYRSCVYERCANSLHNYTCLLIHALTKSNQEVDKQPAKHGIILSIVMIFFTSLVSFLLFILDACTKSYDQALNITFCSKYRKCSNIGAALI